MTTAEKNFEDLKEFLDGLYDTTFIKRNLKKDGESFIQEVLALVTSEKDKSEISMLYSYYVENGSELVIRSINEFAHSHKLHDALAVFPLTDDDVTGLVDQAVSNILFYDRKGDEEILPVGRELGRSRVTPVEGRGLSSRVASEGAREPGDWR